MDFSKKPVAKMHGTTIGFEANAVKAPKIYGDIPLMDRASQVKVVFGDAGGRTATAVGKRDDKDRRPGTPIPFHEPDPDRFEKAEALRLAILAQEKRRGGHGAYDRRIIRQPEPAKRMFRGAAVSKLPDVPTDKVWPNHNCLEADAAVRGERDGVVLFFASAVKAQTAMTGEINNGKNVANAAAGITRGAYGWTWARMKNSKTGPKQAPVRGRTPAK